MRKNIVFLGVFLVMILSCLVVACGSKCNAVLYDNAEQWIKEDFFTKNHTKGAFYEGELSPEDDSNPVSRTFIIDNQEKYNDVFVADVKQLEIDFNNQAFVVFTFTTIYHRDCRIVKFTEKDGNLKITYTMESKSGVGDASAPYQRWFVVKLDLLDIKTVEFEEK